MRPSKLYIKIFISFFLALTVTEVLIFVLFTHSERKITRYRFEQNTAIMVQMLDELIEEKIRWMEGIDSSKEEIKGLIDRIGTIYEAKIWIKGADEIPILKSFSEDIPSDLLSEFDMKKKVFGDTRLYHDFGDIHRIYAFVPLNSAFDENLSLNIIFERKKMMSHKWEFAQWLVIIGVVIAILIIPLSRFITERIKELRQSALRIAAGDLSHRVTITGGDEIGELGRAFNSMTEKLERMIIGGKELTANVSHELRTPLTRIRIVEEILRDKLVKGDYSKWKNHLDDIREDVGALDSLIGRILELSKIDIHELRLNMESLDLSDLLNDLMEQFKSIIELRNLKVKTDFSFSSHIMGDRHSLGVAFSNVFDNAVKFTPENGNIIVKTYSENGFPCVSVINSFRQLTEMDLNKIFEPFHRAERSNKHGTGLGLAITKKILEKHGGIIEALNSTEGFEIRMRLLWKQAKDQAAL